MNDRTVFLRDIQEGDLPQWITWLNAPEIMAAMDRAILVSAEGHERFIAESRASGRALYRAVEHRDVGLCGFVWLWDIHQRHHRAEIRIMIAHPDVRGLGVGRFAIGAISDVAFRELGIHKLYAYVHEDNDASARAFGSQGFEMEARLREEAYRNGKYRDVLRFMKITPP